MNNIDYTQLEYHNWPGRDMTPEVSLYYTAADGSPHRADAYPWPYTAGEWTLAIVVCFVFLSIFMIAIREGQRRKRLFELALIENLTQGLRG